MDYVYEMSIGLFNMSIGHLAEVLDINRNLNFLSKTFNVSVQIGLYLQLNLITSLTSWTPYISASGKLRSSMKTLNVLPPRAP
jgi:hypothetical protein